MSIVAPIAVKKVEESRVSQMDLNNLVYGGIYADHMFVADYKKGKWEDAEITPFGNLSLSPSISALHYGQAIFEGLKAFKAVDGRCGAFRYMDNYHRMNVSALRMGMPEIPEHFFTEGLMKILKMDRAWVPDSPGASLYIRPSLFATDEKIGVHISDSYKFVIFTTPVGIYYPKPLKALIETEFVRAAQGGVGYAKAAGNYGASMYPSKLAHQKGYDQIIWTDAKEHRYFEEAGTMNMMIVIGDTLITPPLSNTTLAGITRDSVLTIARDWKVNVEERPVDVNEVLTALNKGTLQEIFGVGTAATVTHIASIGYKNKDYSLPTVTQDLLSAKIRQHLDMIRSGRTEDMHKWMSWF